MDLSVAEGEALNAADLSPQWRDDVEALLDDYLVKMGIVSGALRFRWIERVVESLQADAWQISAGDIGEEAVERMRDQIRARLAALGDIDPVLGRHEIARRLVVLQGKENSGLLNAIFSDTDAAMDLALLERLGAALAAGAPRPTPPESPLDMPVQAIELRLLVGQPDLPGRTG